ncbi:MAG TPA: hypothetical protein VFI65_11495 [Streptosporangiaceae bacterium]|nr:hypothetical protein [Streptosporangiaceae bacterium]
MTRRIPRLSVAAAVAVVAGASMAATASSAATVHRTPGPWFKPGNLVVSRSVYSGTSSLLTPGVTQLPPGCTSGCVAANNDGSYPGVFNNDQVDASFGVTSPIFLDQVTPSGALVNSLAVPDGTKGGNHVVTSFSSKSEIALNLSTSGKQLSFMGYLATPSNIDVSNSSTPTVLDPTNPVPGTDYRVVAEVDKNGRFRYTLTNSYSGNNGRAAIVNDSHGHRVIYMAGNAGNGGNPQPDGVIAGAGAQFARASRQAESAQTPGAPQPLGSFSITQLGDPLDKVGKDTNFRGLTISNNVIYYTKGSGGNGVNTVYFIDTTGKACPTGVGLPQPGAKLPTSPIAYDPTLLQTQGVTPFNMCILKGFPTALKTKTAFPFGLWFANANTLYVADEGNGDATFSTTSGTFAKAAAQTTAGLQKWVFNGTTWSLAYTISAGLNLGTPYTVANYPTGNNPVTGLPWSPATDGLRNITGRVNGDGTVTVWGITSTVSGNGDQGADPNELVAVKDTLSATSSAGESFSVIRAAGAGEVLRGVSFTPGS